MSSSISDQLLTENNPLAAFAQRIQHSASNTHESIRSISRLLFPIRISSVGFATDIQKTNLIRSSLEMSTKGINLDIQFSPRQNVIHISEKLPDLIRYRLSTIQETYTTDYSADKALHYRFLFHLLKRMNRRL